MRPGLANAFLISFIESIADFGNPILLGGNFSACCRPRSSTPSSARSSTRAARQRSASCCCCSRSRRSSLQRTAPRRPRVHGAHRQGRRRAADRRCPMRSAALCYGVAVPWARSHRRHLRDGARRRFRRDVGPRLLVRRCATTSRRSASNGPRTASCGRAPRGARSGRPSRFRPSRRRSPPASASSSRTCSRATASPDRTRSSSARCSRSRFPAR